MNNLFILITAIAAFPDLFDIDIGGKYWASQHKACGKSCGVCGARCGAREGEVLGCKYSFCRQEISSDGTHFINSDYIKKGYARWKK